MADQPERRPRRYGRFEEHGEVIPSGPVRPLAEWAKTMAADEHRRYTFYRSATHPDYVQREIKPTLDLYGLPHSYAPAVAALIDNSGWSVQAAVVALDQVTVRALPTVKPRRHRFLDFLRRLPGDIADGFRSGCGAIADGWDRVFG